MIKLTSILTIIYLLTGCSSGGQNVKNDFVFEADKPKGLMVIATRLKPNEKCIRPANTLALRYKQTNSDTGNTSGLLNLKNMFISNDFEDPDGYFYIHALDPGRYTFYSVSYMGPGYLGAGLNGLDFDIKANKVNYLGEAMINIDSCGDKPGQTKASIAFSNKSKRDTGLFALRVTKVKPDLSFQKVGK